MEICTRAIIRGGHFNCVTHRVDELSADNVSQIKLEPAKKKKHSRLIFDLSSEQHISPLGSGQTFPGSHPDQCPCQIAQTGFPDQEAVSKSPVL